METWVTRERVFEGRIITVSAGQVRLDDGTLAQREVVEHGGGVGIVPVVDGTVLMVRQYRIALGRAILEIPAGRLEPGDDPEVRARAELEEEVGYRAERLELVATCYPSCGISTQLDYIYLAFGLRPTAVRPEFDERIEIVPLRVSDLEEKLRNRELEDAKSIIGLRELLERYRRLDVDAASG